jgi:hypothetical protein
VPILTLGLLRMRVPGFFQLLWAPPEAPTDRGAQPGRDQEGKLQAITLQRDGHGLLQLSVPITNCHRRYRQWRGPTVWMCGPEMHWPRLDLSQLTPLSQQRPAHPTGKGPPYNELPDVWMRRTLPPHAF